jgi:hypothetical protein
MSSDNKLGTIVRGIVELPQKLVSFVMTAATKIFSPSDDNYPATGIQPFEGEPNEEGKI